MALFLLLYATYVMVAANYYPLKDLIGTFGCYMIDSMEIFGVLSLQTTSFWISLFRYICIVHHVKMHSVGFSPKVRDISFCMNDDNLTKLLILDATKTNTDHSIYWSFCTHFCKTHKWS